MRFVNIANELRVNSGGKVRVVKFWGEIDIIPNLQRRSVAPMNL